MVKIEKPRWQKVGNIRSNHICFDRRRKQNEDSRVNVANQRIERKRTKREIKPFYKVKGKSSRNHIVYGF